MSYVSIEASGVSKSYASREALCNVDLIVRRGEVHGLLGPNGAGKTTLLRVLLGLVRRDAGRVSLLGRDVEPMAGTLPDGVAGMIDVPAFYPYMSAAANLTLLARLDGAKRAARAGAVEAALEQTGLAAYADAKVAGFSAGMRQRLGLAAAMLRSPRLLLLDEPTSSLDPVGARDVRVLLRQLANDGTAIVLSSHDMAEVEDLCATLTIIDCGRTIFQGTVDELRRRAPAAPHRLRTSDDWAAQTVAARLTGIRVKPIADSGLEVLAENLAALDTYVVALGRSGIAIRALEHRARSLESIFFDLTGAAALDTVCGAGADQDTDEPDWELVS